MAVNSSPSANDRQHGGDHYKGSTYQHWDWAHDVRLPYLAGVASKYAFRWRKKNGAEDLEKGIHYLEKCIEVGLMPLPVTDRADKFWRLVIANDVYPSDAAAMYWIMEGEWARARAILLGLLEMNAQAQEQA